MDFKYVVLIDKTVLHLSWISVPASCTNIYRTYIHIVNYGVGDYRWMFLVTNNNISVMCWQSAFFGGSQSILGKTINFQQLRDRSIN